MQQKEQVITERLRNLELQGRRKMPKEAIINPQLQNLDQFNLGLIDPSIQPHLSYTGIFYFNKKIVFRRVNFWRIRILIPMD